MLNRLKIELRQNQIFLDSDPTQPVVIQCNLDGTVEYVPGVVPQSNYIDFSDYVENLNDFTASWQATTTDYSEGGESNANSFGSNYSKGVTLELRFIGAAFEFIYNWLMLEPCQLLNSIEVKITDLDCMKAFRTFEIKLENTTYSPTLEPCIVSMRLREKDQLWHAFTKTTIEDNWQNWFNKAGNAVKEHPAFLYIVEKKPKFFLTILIVIAYIAGILSIGALVLFTDGKRWIRKLLGICYFCPSPFIRTYIENICLKYGYTWDTIFDDLPGNIYKDVCLFYPAEKSYGNFDDYTADELRFIWDNRTGLPFNAFLDQLKKVFNCEWYITPNSKLVFKPRAFFDGQPAIIDFTTSNIPLIGLKYTFSGNKQPAYGAYNYKLDPADQCTNDVKWRYNAIVDFDGRADNPMLEGNVTKNFDFACTAFNRDGSEQPYFESSIKLGRIIAVAAVVVGLAELLSSTGGLTVFIAAALVVTGYGITNGFINDFMNPGELEGVVRVSNNSVNYPRLLLYDTNTPMNAAKVVSVTDPAKNLYYNTDNVDYYQEHSTLDEPGFFGTDQRKVFNYPLFVEEKFAGNLWDRFHEHDNPLKNLDINQTWEGQVQLCCDMLTIFGVWDGDFAKIGAVVILENRNGRLIKGRIEGIDPKYKEGYISLKGRVLK
jgi:hypothetical protein